MKIVPTRIGVPFLSRRRDNQQEAAAREGIRKTASNTSDPTIATDSDTPTVAPKSSSLFGTLPRDMFRKPAASQPTQPTTASSTQTVTPALVQARKPWRKLLYIKQDYADDYVDDTFLMELQKNTNVRMYDYSTVVQQTTVVTQHLSSIMVFLAVFINLRRGSLTGEALVWGSTTLTMVGFGFWGLLNYSLRTPEQRVERWNLIKGAVFFTLLLFGLSPILRTLTEDTSSDTIWAMTVMLFFGNLAFHDYSTGNLTNIRFPGSVSLNAAVLAGVLLASRLDSNMCVFAFLSFALEWFALFPIMRRYLKRISAKASMIMTLVLALLAWVLFLDISQAVAMIHVLGTLFITFGCPLWLIWIQRYKNEIHGPWDEARPIVHRYFR
ncbi:phosphatidylinositol N-acetylglucosaminyltransferase [Linderina pennispora]|uniref:Phosphatidylinositol N-acetylglucosaminyltransferase n=1 Tax=Linderina pennispora TaxID=61395 RepID=A0A1Y1WN32_9FUNG|nr:phosphatidylinositol N-acetylglucosaminyltransferase [Linderina pennispora]ORX74626.1 phosphatidylinositol N-acetylglucosaminyltransferase [Linderina pennispora]